MILHIVMFHYAIGLFNASFGAVFRQRHGNREIVSTIHTPDDLNELREGFSGYRANLCQKRMKAQYYAHIGTSVSR